MLGCVIMLNCQIDQKKGTLEKAEAGAMGVVTAKSENEVVDAATSAVVSAAANALASAEATVEATAEVNAAANVVRDMVASVASEPSEKKQHDMELFGVFRDTAFTVEVDAEKNGHYLRELLKEKFKINAESYLIRIYDLFMENEGKYMLEQNAFEARGGKQIIYSKNLRSAFRVAEPERVHFRVEIYDPESAKTLTEKINNVLETVSRKRQRSECEVSSNGKLAFSSIKYDDVSEFYGPITKYYKQDCERIPAQEMQLIYDDLARHKKCMGLPDDSANERTKSAYVQLLIRHICCLFGDDEQVQMKLEVDLEAPGVNARGRADIVVSRGNRRVLIIEVKREEVSAGLGQTLLMLDSSRLLNKEKSEDTSETYAICTDFTRWIFLKRTENEVFKESRVIDSVNRLEEDVELIAEKIYSILKNC